MDAEISDLIADIKNRLDALPRTLGDDMRALPPVRDREEMQSVYERLFGEEP